jgi:hypothetical protein
LERTNGGKCPGAEETALNLGGWELIAARGQRLVEFGDLFAESPDRKVHAGLLPGRQG